MALKALLLKKQIDNKTRSLEALRAKSAEFDTREAELMQAIDEVETEEQRAEVQGMVDQFEADKAENAQAIADLERELEALENDLAAEEAAQVTEPQAAAEPEERSDNAMFVPEMNTRDRLANIVTRDDVQAYLGEVRTAMREKRAITNVGLTIPEVMLGLLKENVTEYSHLYGHVTVRAISGVGRMNIMGAVPEAIWTDCCANLNELTLGFNDVEVDCFKVGGYFAICNANLEDSDVALASEILSALGQAIGIALDRAILYGRNSSSTMKMPYGIVTRLVETAEPSGYSATARPWADLSTTNVISIASTSKAATLFQNIIAAIGNASHKYGAGQLTWVMNEKTYYTLVSEALTINASGAIVSGMGNTMPVIGGAVELLSLIPDNVIIAGYFDMYLLAERAGQQFASSDQVRFLQDQTVFKGLARYDGVPVIAEAFVAIGLNGVTPDATSTFPADTAN